MSLNSNIWDAFWTNQGDGAECCRKVASGRRVPRAIMSLVSARDLQLQRVRVVHEAFLVPVVMYGSETMLWKEKERPRIRAVHMDNLRGLLDIGRMDIVTNVRIRELCGVAKGVDERIDEGVLRWFGHVERIERVYVGECADSHSVSRPRKKWIDTVIEDYLKKKGLNVRQARRMVQDMNEWGVF